MSLSSFLVGSKEHYLRAIREGKGREWTVVMGNEAGDLDSAASSIAYSWFASTVQKTSCVALLQTSRKDLELRPENIHAFKLAPLSSNQEELLCIDDVPPSPIPFPSNRFALVDHNRLLPRYSDQNEDVKVVAVLDHHEDEGLYKDTADPRIIVVPTGSASSIVARYIEQSTSQIPSGIARLLLCAILVDTGGLMPGGKAEELDRAAAAYLLPRAELPTISAFVSHDNPTLFTLANELLVKKADVTQLSTNALLRRDYKQYAWTDKTRTVEVGLSTVPLDLRKWLARDSLQDFWRDTDTFMTERDLDVLGILTTFHKERRAKKKKHGGDEGAGAGRDKGKHKRQMMIVARDVPGGNLQQKLFSGLEGTPELALKERLLAEFASKYSKDNHQASDLMQPMGATAARVYEQGNAHVTRKLIAPLMKSIIEEGAESI
ncbi:PPX1 [Sanghuangporus sanghuang]